MAQPTTYNRQTSFSNYQALNPADPLPGSTLDSELNAIKTTLDGILTNLALIQANDGGLANGVVDRESFDADIEVGWSAPEVWVTATAYVVGDTVFHGAGFYRCLVAHTAGTFATDLAASKWEIIVDLSALTIVDADQIAVTPAGNIAATNVQAALVELDSEKAASSHTHPSSAISDSTSAGRNMLTAANVAAQQTLLGLGDLAYLDTIPVTDIDAQLALSGIIEPAALAANTNDWAPTGIATASTIRMSASAAGINITGILAPATDGEIKILENVGSYEITLAASSASSAAAHRFLFPKPMIVGPNGSIALKYDADATTPRWRLLDRAAHLPRGYIDGLILSNNSGDATNDIDVAAGECRGTRGILDLVLTAALTGKRLDADWTAGASQGMRYSGAAITDTTYHVFLIGTPAGVVDVFAYAGGTDPTSVLPSGYIDYRRIGSIVRASSAIKAFSQFGDEFLWTTAVVDADAVSVGTTAALKALTLPVGVKMLALFAAQLANGGEALLITSPDETNQAASVNGPFSYTNEAAGTNTGSPHFPVRTDTSAQVRVRATSNSLSYSITTRGWIDARGKNS